MFIETAKKSAFSDARKRCASRHSHSHDKSVCSDTAKLQRSVMLRKVVLPGTHTATISPRSVTRQKCLRLMTLEKLVHPSLRLKRQHSGTLQRSVTLIKEVYPPVHAAPTSSRVVTRQRLMALRSAVHPQGRKKSKRFVALQRLAMLGKYRYTLVCTQPWETHGCDETALSDT